MELRQLRYFIAVAEERHFGRAAERLHIAQPGLSQQIKTLERSIRAVLIDREPRPVRLTPAGERLLPIARTIVEAADRAVESVREGSSPSVVRTGVLGNGPFPELADLLARSRDEVPDVEMRLVPSSTPAIVDAVARRSVDLGVVHEPFEWSGPEAPRYLRLGERELVVALPEGHRLAALDELPRVSLLNEPFLWWPDAVLPSVAAFAREALFGTTEHPHVIETVDGVDEGRLEQVRRGIGLTSILIPASGDLPSPPGGVVFRRVEPPRPLIGYGLLWVEPNASPATARFLEVARRIVADPPGTDDAAARRPRRAWSS